MDHILYWETNIFLDNQNICRILWKGNVHYRAHNSQLSVLILRYINLLDTLTLRLIMSYIYGAPSKARNANVVYIWTYVWQR